MSNDTIVAIATPPGRGGLGVVRLSGPEARAVTEQLVRFRRAPRWRPWTVQYAELTDDAGEMIDQAVVAFFASPRSYTGEDVVEISCHGSPVILQAAVTRAVRCGARPARPGEFTRRAVRHGRLDVTQAEAVRDLIDATTLHQAQLAARQVDGSLSRRVAPLKERLITLISLLEAAIDFAEDGVDELPDAETAARLAELHGPLAALVQGFALTHVLRQGATVALIGRPNVGKSSLFNRLLGEDRAIVTELPGTTRDVIAEVRDWNGLPVRLMDTAGLRDPADVIEQHGINRSRQAMADADVTLVVLDRSLPPTPADQAVITEAAAQGRWLVVGNKSDLPAAPGHEPALSVSASTGEGIEGLRHAIRAMLLPSGNDLADWALTTARQEQHLREALTAVEAASSVAATVPPELLLVHLHDALHALDALTGATMDEDILDRIFATFCIGK